jgi:hypothetical protein
MIKRSETRIDGHGRVRMKDLLALSYHDNQLSGRKCRSDFAMPCATNYSASSCNSVSNSRRRRGPGELHDRRKVDFVEGNSYRIAYPAHAHFDHQLRMGCAVLLDRAFQRSIDNESRRCCEFNSQ